MFNETSANSLSMLLRDLPDSLLEKNLFFHDVRVRWLTNHPSILALLNTMLGAFPEPEHIRAEASYNVFCYESTSQFPLQLPRDRIRMETVRLLTGTTLKYSMSHNYLTEYHSYTALPSMNGAALSAITPSQNIALTELELPEHYQTSFLRRYVLLLALGQLVRPYGFVPCHAAAITAPWDQHLGALIVGASESGKTTLSLGCAITGFGLLGDDLIMLRENLDDGVIHAHAITQEVSVRSDTLDLLKSLSFLHTIPADLRDKRYCTIEQIRSGATRMQTPIRLLIFPSLTGETPSRILPLSKANVLHELIDQCMSKVHAKTQEQEKLFFILSKLAEQACGFRLEIARGTTDGPALIRSLFTGGYDE